MQRSTRGLCGAISLALVLAGPVLGGTGTDAFVRGDANSDGSIDIGDSVFILSSLFAGGPEPACGDAADTNDDGSIDIADSVYLLSFLFLPGSPPPPAPYPAEGVDLTADGIICGPLCVDPAQFVALVPALFPVSVCVPEIPFSESGVTGAVCTSTVGPICSPLSIAGCDLTATLDSFTYDGPTQTFALSSMIIIDPLGIEATIPIFGLQTCTTTALATVTGTAVLDTIPVAPGVVEVVGITVETQVDSVDVDFSPCGLLAPFGDLLIDLFVAQAEALADQLVADTLEPQIVGAQLCE